MLFLWREGYFITLLDFRFLSWLCLGDHGHFWISCVHGKSLTSCTLLSLFIYLNNRVLLFCMCSVLYHANHQNACFLHPTVILRFSPLHRSWFYWWYLRFVSTGNCLASLLCFFLFHREENLAAWAHGHASLWHTSCQGICSWCDLGIVQCGVLLWTAIQQRPGFFLWLQN